MKIFYSLIGIMIGIMILKYTPQLYRFFGADPDAEKYLGRGGTFTFLKLFALAVVIISMMFLVGIF